MKKLSLIIVGLLIVISMQAQFGTLQSLGSTEVYKIVTPVAGDTIHGSDAASKTHYYTFFLNKTKLQYFSFLVELDTVKTHHRVLANHVWVQVSGSLDNATWVDIGSPVKFGASADSTFSYSDVATGNLWRYLRIRFSGVTANKCTLLKKTALKVADTK